MSFDKIPKVDAKIIAKRQQREERARIDAEIQQGIEKGLEKERKAEQARLEAEQIQQRAVIQKGPISYPERTRRHAIVCELFLQGYNIESIFKIINDRSSKYYIGCNKRQTSAYLRHSLLHVKEFSNYNKEVELGLALKRLDELYTAAFNSKNYSTCLNIITRRAELLGLSLDGQMDAKLSALMQQIETSYKKLNRHTDKHIEKA